MDGVSGACEFTQVRDDLRADERLADSEITDVKAAHGIRVRSTVEKCIPEYECYLYEFWRYTRLMADEQENSEQTGSSPESEKPGKSLWVQYGEYSHLALVLPVGVGIGWFFGSWIDGKMNTHWIQWVGLLFGLVSGFWELIRATKKMNREN